MRIAVPLRGGLLSDHFGDSSMLALLDVDEQQRRIVSRQDLPTPPHRPGVLPTWIADQGAELILVGSMGQRARAILDHRKVRFVAGVAAQPAEQAVMLWLNGQLQADGGACDHTGHHHAHGQGHDCGGQDGHGHQHHGHAHGQHRHE